MTRDNPGPPRSPRRAEADRRLGEYLARLGLASPPAAARRDSAGRRLPTPADAALAGSRPTPSAEPGLNVNVNLNGGAVFLDDERQLRALAKEIKRLITEDKRRGIGI